MDYGSLFQHEIVHLLLSLFAGLVVWRFFRTKSKKKAKAILYASFLGAFIGEFLLDTDHLFDYLLVFGSRFRLDYFLKGVAFDMSQKVYVLFHSWELIALFLIASSLVKRNIMFKCFLVAVSVGIFVHIVYDTSYYHFNPWGYSLIYRFLHGFSQQVFR